MTPFRTCTVSLCCVVLRTCAPIPIADPCYVAAQQQYDQACTAQGTNFAVCASAAREYADIACPNAAANYQALNGR